MKEAERKMDVRVIRDPLTGRIIDLEVGPNPAVEIIRLDQTLADIRRAAERRESAVKTR